MPKNKLTQGISPQEKKVLILLCIGFTMEEIAELLFIDFETVKTHSRNMRTRYDKRSLLGVLFTAFYKGHFHFKAHTHPFNAANALTQNLFLN